MAKLDLTADTQKMILFGLGGLFTVLNLVLSFTGGSSAAPSPTAPRQLAADASIWTNPEMTWIEKRLCRGYQRAESCDYRLLHPLAAKAVAEGHVVVNAPPQKRVVARRLTASNGSIVTSSKVVVDYSADARSGADDAYIE